MMTLYYSTKGSGYGVRVTGESGRYFARSVGLRDDIAAESRTIEGIIAAIDAEIGAYILDCAKRDIQPLRLPAWRRVVGGHMIAVAALVWIAYGVGLLQGVSAPATTYVVSVAGIAGGFFFFGTNVPLRRT